MINVILPEQVEHLRTLESLISMSGEETSGVLVARLSAILKVPVALYERRGRTWETVEKTGDVPPPGVIGSAWQRAVQAESGEPPVARVIAITDQGYWTCLSFRPGTGRPLVLALAGDWTLSERLLAEFATRSSAKLKALTSRRGKMARQGSFAYALARRLARAADRSDMYDLIVSACAKAVSGRVASLALYDEEEQALAIAATYGYPAILVKHLRFPPGVGIIGSVYLARRPLRVDDVRGYSASPARLRYRTPSFLSTPLFGPSGTLGVMNVADRRDEQPFDRSDLTMLRHLGGVAALALDRMRAMEQADGIARAAAIDQVTSLFNRRHFLTRLEEEIERARRQGTQMAILMIDVDNFKQVNDRLGHPGGDAVLRAIGDVLRRSVRLFDVCARFGGDEFAILMPGTTATGSAQIAERIRQEVEGSRAPLGPWSDDLKVTASIGIVNDAGTLSAEALIARADQALYVAKREGKNRVRFDES